MDESPVPNIYEKGDGDALVDEENYPDLIREYIQEEAVLIERLVKPYKVVMEVGCMTGRHTKQILECGKRYVGIDMVDRYIENAREKFSSYNSEDVIFCRSDIHNIESLFSRDARLSSIMEEKALLLFPFNSFGNMNKIEDLVIMLNRLGKDYLIDTFRDTDLSSAVRSDYYKRCGFNNLEIHKTAESVCFTSENGLCSTAYNKVWFENRFKAVVENQFGKIGVGFICSEE